VHDWHDGNKEALDQLIPIVYDDLRVLAARQLAREWRHNRLETTVVVNEAYLKLFRQRNVDWQNRSHFFAIAAQIMRRILVDHARRELREKHGGGAVHVELGVATMKSEAVPLDVVEAMALDRALQQLEAVDPDLARLVELRFYTGLTVQETAAALDISPATVKRDWVVAKAWLHPALTRGGSSA
jgi:RNA polymerase sigma factor (TIGR02999 family)